MLASGLPFTAVIAFDDLTALGVVRGLTEAGIRIPEECSVMGFDDVLPAVVATPAMTTIRQPLSEMGRDAAQQVLRAIRKGSGKPEKALLHQPQPELVIRRSTAYPPAKGTLEAIRNLAHDGASLSDRSEAGIQKQETKRKARRP
jgi:LacI family transcriptional regulator